MTLRFNGEAIEKLLRGLELAGPLGSFEFSLHSDWKVGEEAALTIGSRDIPIFISSIEGNVAYFSMKPKGSLTE